MAWTGDTLSVLTEILNERPMDDLIESLNFRNGLYHRVMKTAQAEDFYGEYAKLLIHTTGPMNAVPRAEGGDVVLPGADAFVEMRLTEAQYMSSVGWTQEEVEIAIRKQGSAMIDLVNMKLKNAPLDMRFKLNHAYTSDGTGRLARVSACTETTVSTTAAVNTLTVDNSAADFGWPTTKHIRNGMLVDVLAHTSVTDTTFPIISTWTPSAIACVVSEVNHTAGTFKISQCSEPYSRIAHTSTLGTTIADGMFVLIHDSINFTAPMIAVGTAYTFSSWAGSPGLLAIVDGNTCSGHEFGAGGDTYNGSWYGKGFQTTGQTVSRASYSSLLGRVIKAGTWGGITGGWGSGTAGTAQACNLEVINAEIRRIDEESETDGMVTGMYMNGATRDWMAGLAFSAQNAMVQMTPEQLKVIPGIPSVTAFRSATGRLIPVIPCSQMADGHITMGDERDLILFQSIPLDWYTGYGGKVIPSPGSRNLTFEAWLRAKCRLAAKRCDNWTRIEDIDIAA